MKKEGADATPTEDVKVDQIDALYGKDGSKTRGKERKRRQQPRKKREIPRRKLEQGQDTKG